MTTPDPLHLPATIPGLLRRGSPVVFYSVRDAVAVTVSGVVVDVGPDRATVASADRALVGSRALMDLSLDLSDATGRHHALLWLAGREELAPDEGAVFGGGNQRVWCLYPPEGDPQDLVTYGPSGAAPDLDVVVPTLADLDPTSDERLPDGSRRVDALALARVVAHVAGVARG